jgi:hypothetical protein
MGLLARAIGILTSPRATFERVVAGPRPVGILLLSALVIGLAAGIPQFNDTIRQSILDQQVDMGERFRGRALTDAEYAQAERGSHYGPYWAIVGTLIFMPIVSLLFAAIYWVVFNTVMGGTAAFKQVLAIVTHSQVITAVGSALAAPIQFMQGRVTTGGPFNLGAALPMLEERSTLATLLGVTNVFTIWGLIVTAIGLAVLYRRKSTNIAIGLLVAYFAIAYTLISVVGGMFGGGAGR